MQGIIVTPGGDVWAADIEKSQMVYMPKGDPAKGKLLFQNKTGDPKDNPGKLASPFHLAIDQKDHIWVSNVLADWVTRFRASDPSKVETFKVGFSPSGMAIDSQGNVWVTNRLPNSKRGEKVLGEMLAAAKAGKGPDVPLTRAMQMQKAGPEGGSVTILRPDGSQAPGSPVSGNGLAGPWAAAVDGNDHVWISNFANPTVGIVELAGSRPEANPPGLKMGDPISPPGGYVGGGLQAQIDIGIGPAGDVWVGNNWNNFDAVYGRVPEPLQMQGGGQGVVVFYGMAKPVRTPLIGPAQRP
jgi:streptogramin lyase